VSIANGWMKKEGEKDECIICMAQTSPRGAICVKGRSLASMQKYHSMVHSMTMYVS